MDKKPLAVANWKMQLSHKAALQTAKALDQQLKKIELASDVVLAASYPSLPELGKGLKDSPIELAAQHVHWEEKGAVTGFVAANQVDEFVDWCLVGHSETRASLNLSEEQVASSMAVLLQHKITPIVCVGEALEERQAGQTVQKITNQVNVLFNKLDKVSIKKVAIAYEPIWAISTNAPAELPDPAEVASTMLLVRKLAVAAFGAQSAESLRVLYGGSVSPETIDSYVSEPGVNGVLVGGASLHPGKFVDIIKSLQSHAS